MVVSRKYSYCGRDREAVVDRVDEDDVAVVVAVVAVDESWLVLLVATKMLKREKMSILRKKGRNRKTKERNQNCWSRKW